MEITHSIRIARPARDVSAFVTDYANDTKWREGVLEMTVRGRQTHERLTFLGSTYVTEGEIVEQTERRLAFRGASPDVESHGYREVVDHGATVVTYSLTLRPKKFLLRLLAPILRVLYSRRVRRDLAALRDLLEHAPSALEQRRYDAISRSIV
jgi:hypothetical protein